MAGQIPSFITGANAKIKIGNLTMAYAQDVSYSVDVATIPVETIGRYEVVTNEPISYYVSGTLSVIRYTKAATKGATEGAAGLSGVTNKDGGNSINNWSQGGSAKIGDQFNPGSIIASKTFDLEIFSKLDATGTGATQTLETIIKVRDCRFTRKSGSVTKRGLIVDQFAFSAVLMDHDGIATNAAKTSGDPDL